MKRTKIKAVLYALPLTLAGYQASGQSQPSRPLQAQIRPEGPCDIYARDGAPCVAAHSSTRALYGSYNGPLYQVIRQSDGHTLDVGVVNPSPTRPGDRGGYANAAAQDAFCADTTCFVSILYDQSPKGNHLVQAPRGYFLGPVPGGFNNLPVADMAPITIMGHKVYGIFMPPGSGLRLNDAKGTAVDDQAEGQYWVIDGQHYNSGCCFDYGNGEIDSRDDGNGTMETPYFGNSPWWYFGPSPGPWIMTDQENNLVGCVNDDDSKLCSNLKNIDWRFVTAMAKGKPHHWATLGGDAQRGPLSVIFDGPRIDATYDPMRKQGAIVLGNGGDNSNGAQGTFYEGVMTAPDTYPSHETDQKIQANVVAASYDVQRLKLTAKGASQKPHGLQTFPLSGEQESDLTFINTTGQPIAELSLALRVPTQWSAMAEGTEGKIFTARQIAPGARVTATFRVKSADASYNGDIFGIARWKSGSQLLSEMTSQKVRAAAPVKINEFRVSDGSENPTNAFIELFNAGDKPIDLSNWVVDQHQIQQARVSNIQIPAGVILEPGRFYVLGLANSGLSLSAKAGDTDLYVRSIAGMKVGDTVIIGARNNREIRKIVRVGTASGKPTTIWQPLPEGPVISVQPGSTNVPVEHVAGFAVGEKIALGYGTSYPVTGGDILSFEVATVNAVGKPGSQAYLAVEARPGDTNIKVTPIENISPGDVIRLDIDTIGHGIETVKVQSVGSGAKRSGLRAVAEAGSNSLTMRTIKDANTGKNLPFTVGEKILVGTPANLETVTITSVDTGDHLTRVTVSPRLASKHIVEEDIIEPGSGLTLEQPLKYLHAANLPFSARGTGIEFAPATHMIHSSNEPIVPLGTGIALNRPLARNHAIEDVVQVPGVSQAGFQGKADQWFGGPALSPYAGTIILRDARGNIADSLNYGYLVDPIAVEGYQKDSGLEKVGCFAAGPALPFAWAPATRVKTDVSVGRFPDGRDSDSNCQDFSFPAATLLASDIAMGTNNLKIDMNTGFAIGQSVLIGTGSSAEKAQIVRIGSPGATRLQEAAQAGAGRIIVTSRVNFKDGQPIMIDREETTLATIRTIDGRFVMTLTKPLQEAHSAAATVAGTGITLAVPLKLGHKGGDQIVTDSPTPGAPNSYQIPRNSR